MKHTDVRYVRINTLSMFGAMILCAFVSVALIPMWYGTNTPFLLLAAGGLLMLVAIPFHILAGSQKVIQSEGRRWLYIPAVLLNVIGTSLCEAAYYTQIKAAPPVNDLIAGALIPSGICLLFCLGALLLPRRFKLLSGIYALLTLGLIVLCIVCWVNAGLTAQSVIWSFGLFKLVCLLITEIAHVYTCSEVTDGLEYATGEDSSRFSWTWMRYLSFAAFGLFMIVGAVVLAVLACVGGDCDCDCDCIDCGDCCDPGDCCDSGGVRKAKKKSK